MNNPTTNNYYKTHPKIESDSDDEESIPPTTISQKVDKFCVGKNGNPQHVSFHNNLKKAQTEFEFQQLKRILREEFHLGINLTPKQILIKEHLEYLKLKKREFNADKRNDKYIWLTINPPPKNMKDVNPLTFVKDIQQLLKKTCIVAHEFCIEKFTKSGEHIHAHILIERNLKYKPCLIKQKLLRTPFRKKYFTSHKITDNNFNFQKIGKDFKKDKEKYLRDKTGYKDPLRQKDIEWRKKHNIRDIITNNSTKFNRQLIINKIS